MKKTRVLAIASSFVLITGSYSAVAQEEKEEAGNGISPVEIFVCNYNDGKGPDDMAAATKGWNKWADKRGVDDYFAMTMTPYYYGDDTFDVAWLGSSQTAEALGALQETYIAEGGKEAEAFADAVSCQAHANFATLMVQAPPDRESPDQLTLAFSDCNLVDGVSLDDMFTGLEEWVAYMKENAYESGSWIMFPAYGGGGEKFDFKMVSGWDDLASMGRDYDKYGAAGWEHHSKMMGNKLSCDASRVYRGNVVRRPTEE